MGRLYKATTALLNCEHDNNGPGPTIGIKKIGHNRTGRWDQDRETANTFLAWHQTAHEDT
jgi:hypothetical protein